MQLSFRPTSTSTASRHQIRPSQVNTAARSWLHLANGLPQDTAKQYTHVATSVCQHVLFAGRGPELGRKEIRGLSDFGPAQSAESATRLPAQNLPQGGGKRAGNSNFNLQDDPHPRQRPHVHSSSSCTSEIPIEVGLALCVQSNCKSASSRFVVKRARTHCFRC